MRDAPRHVVGAGLLALDIVLPEEHSAEAFSYAGGTCGNVLAILSYLSWRSSAIGYVGDDAAGARVLDDLKQFGVNSTYLVRSRSVRTPVFIQHLRQDATGHASHHFSRQCPHCGERIAPTREPAYSRIPAQDVFEAGAADVFFMDRLSDDILAIAYRAKAAGARIFYEPSIRSDAKFWASAMTLVDVLKYSADRFAPEDFHCLPGYNSHDFWEVQTMGERGLRFRRQTAYESIYQWNVLPAISAPRVVDTCGAGDWCSAGLIRALFASGYSTTESNFAAAARQGQALAAWACAFVGARGAMYWNEASTTLAAAESLYQGGSVDLDCTQSATRRARRATTLTCSPSTCIAGEGPAKS